MSEVDLKKAGGITGAIDISDRCARLLGQLCFSGSAIDPRAIRALSALTDSVDVSDRCARSLGQLCFGGVPIDPRDRNWDLNFATDQVDISGSSVDVTDRCTRLLGQTCVGGVAIDPRDRNWDLNFASDQVDASGSTVTATISGTPDVNVTDRESREVGLVTMKDAFMELRLMADYLKDIPLALHPSTGRVRINIEESISLPATITSGTVTNIVNFGSVAANSLIPDTMDIVWNTGIRTNGII